MRTRFVQRVAAGAGAALLLAAGIAEAQWVFLARHAIGRVEQMSQQAKAPSGPSYDSATVMLDAPADRVYATVLRHIKARTDLTLTQDDPKSMVVQFTNGAQIAGVTVNAMGDNLSQLMIVSAHTGAQPNAANLVVDGVLRVCGEMKIECSRAGK